jgi:phage terminase small subunit
MSRVDEKPPAGLSRRARAVWRDVLRDYSLESRHLTVLESALRTLDRLDAARAIVDRDGMIVAGSKGQVRPHPMLAVERDCRISLARLWRELDLDGASAPDARLPRVG